MLLGELIIGKIGLKTPRAAPVLKPGCGALHRLRMLHFAGHSRESLDTLRLGSASPTLNPAAGLQNVLAPKPKTLNPKLWCWDWALQRFRGPLTWGTPGSWDSLGITSGMLPLVLAGFRVWGLGFRVSTLTLAGFRV